MSVIDDDAIRGQILRAWQESLAGTAGAHEEGGFILRSSHGALELERWPVGAANEIVVPAHSGGRRNGRLIVATFHTHPNPPPEFQQEPSLTDIRGVRDDPELNNVECEGEFVVSKELIFVVRKTGRVELVGETKSVLGASKP